MRVIDVIRQKRDGGTLDRASIDGVVAGVTDGSLPDYQAAALLMAILLRGMTTDETAHLTDAMVRSGVRLSYPDVPGVPVDKHSTGGVGDKTSLILAPLAVACGAVVPMMSGRGLGHTGGTLDKLEAIPGFRTALSLDEIRRAIASIRCALVGQTDEIAPADRRLYALRDVTATVDIVPLIASSIMSKKLAAGAQAMVLDVKVGDGAFMKTIEDARILAEQMVDLGRRAGRDVVCLLTAMDQPLGAAVGNALEVREAVETIVGEGPPDLTELVLDASARLLALSDLGIDADEGRERAQQAMSDGSARDVYERWIRAQGGDPDPEALPKASVVSEVRAPRAGIVTRLAALPVGVAALELGGGRRTKDDEIDHAVGVVCSAKRGQTVEAGQVLADVHARDEDSAARAVETVAAAYEIGDEVPPVHGILLDVVA